LFQLVAKTGVRDGDIRSNLYYSSQRWERVLLADYQLVVAVGNVPFDFVLKDEVCNDTCVKKEMDQIL
jgi:hypothetical protein